MSEHGKPPPAAKGRLLIVDDDKNILILLEKILKNIFDIRKATAGKDALAIINDGFSPHVIISDYMMPEMDGGEFLKQSIAIVPDAVRIVLSVDSDPKTIIPILSKAQALMYINKPFKNLEMFQASNLALNYNRLRTKLKRSESLLSDDQQSELQSNSSLEEKVNALNAELQELNSKQSEESAAEKQLTELQKKIKTLESRLSEKNEYINELQQKIDDLEQAPQDLPSDEEDKNDSLSIALPLSALISEIDKMSYTNHTYAVSVLVKELAEQLEFDEQQKEDAIAAALLHCAPLMLMPNYFQIAYPFELKGNQKDRYFHYFDRPLRMLKHHKLLARPIELITMLWERNNNTGLPNGIGPKDFPVEAQILAVANLYVFMTYRVTDKDFNHLRSKRFVAQGPDIALRRHNQTVKSIVQNRMWYDEKVIDAFRYLMEEEKTKLMKTINIPGKVDIKELVSIDELHELSEVQHQIDNLIVEHYDEDLLLDFGSADGLSRIRKVRKIHISELSNGMLLAEDIKADNGSQVAKAYTVINPDSMKNINFLSSKGMIDNDIMILVPFAEAGK